MIRALALALVAAAVLTAAATASLSWRTVATGTADPTGVRATGYLALTRWQERTWIDRVETADRPGVQAAVTAQRAIVAVFLDGLPCARDVAVGSLTRTGSTLTVHVAFTRPPIGVAMCVRSSTPYAVLSVARSSLGKPVPTHVDVVARARA